MSETKTPTPPTFDEFLSNVDALKEKGGVDLSMAEDLSIAVMNLISLEEHFFFTGVKTKKDQYFDTACEVREMRKTLLQKLMPEHEGETWCASKHLLAATMRLIEVGTRLQSEERKAEAREMFEKAYTLYSLFWGLKVNLVGVRENAAASKSGDRATLQDLVTKLADCCNE